MLGGLIPLFIGLAQVTTAFLTDPDLFAMVLGRRGAFGPYPAPRTAGGAASVRTGRRRRNTTPRTRTGPAGTQELRPPTPPPEPPPVRPRRKRSVVAKQQERERDVVPLSF